jgi:hypothetical protein
MSAVYQRPALSWIKRRARRLQRAYGVARRLAIFDAWLDYDLREAGHVHRLLDAHGNACWDVVRQSDAKELPEAPPENVAQPRRVSMFGPEWVPPKGPAMRPGAMDYATVPSLHMGQRRPFRSGL